jgi:hypothetical protein
MLSRRYAPLRTSVHVCRPPVGLKYAEQRCHITNRKATLQLDTQDV